MAKTNFDSGVTSKSKRLIAGVSALVIMATAGGYAAGTLGLLDAINSTKISGPEQPGNVDENGEKTYIAAPFDINNADEVNARAKTIYDLLSKETKEMFTQNDIRNIIYIINGKYESIRFSKGMKDVDKYAYLEGLKHHLVSLLADNTYEEANVMAGVDGYAAKDMKSDDFVWGSYLYATADTNKDLYEQFAVLAKKQVELKKNGSTNQELVENANKYYDLVESIAKNKELSEQVRWSLLVEAKAKAPLFTYVLTKKQVKYIDTQYQRVVDNRTFDTVYDYLELDPDALDCMTTTKTTTPYGAHYDAKDAAAANAGQGVQKEDKVVDEGGKKKGTVTKGSGNGKPQGTTSTTTYTTIPKTNPENGEKVKQKTTHKEETSKGGQPVGTTKKEVIEDPKATTTTTKKNETTTTSTTKYEEPEMLWDDEINVSAENNNVPTAAANVKSVSTSDSKVNYAAIIAGATAMGGLGFAVVKYEDDKKKKEAVKSLKGRK